MYLSCLFIIRKYYIMRDGEKQQFIMANEQFTSVYYGTVQNSSEKYVYHKYIVKILLNRQNTTNTIHKNKIKQNELQQSSSMYCYFNCLKHRSETNYSQHFKCKKVEIFLINDKYSVSIYYENTTILILFCLIKFPLTPNCKILSIFISRIRVISVNSSFKNYNWKNKLNIFININNSVMYYLLIPPRCLFLIKLNQFYVQCTKLYVVMIRIHRYLLPLVHISYLRS